MVDQEKDQKIEQEALAQENEQREDAADEQETEESALWKLEEQQVALRLEVKDLAQQAADNQELQMDSLFQRLENMETLMEKQNSVNKKISRSKSVQSFLLLCLVIILGIGIFSLNVTIQSVTKDVPELVDTTTQTVEDVSAQLSDALEEINSIDFETLNEAINGMEEGISSIDFDALNESILDLQKVVESLAKVTSVLW